MKRKYVKYLCLFLVFLCVITIWSCKQEKPVDFSSHKIQELDSFLLKTTQNLPVPGIAIVVIKNNMVYYKAIGKTQFPNGPALTDSTLFFTGNLSEPMVATAIIKLANDGKINLDDPVVKHLPYFQLGDSSYRHITIRHLLTHTSGVPYHSAIWDMPYNKDDALEKTTRSIHLQQPLFKPAGSRIKRTPYNFDILADLISKVSQTSFEEFMDKNVFTPLNMYNSTYNKNEIADNMLAYPHRIDNWLTYAIKRDSIYPYNREHAGSIGLHASVKDLSLWMYMLLNNGETAGNAFIDKKLAEELMSVQFKTKNADAIGLGWEIKKVGDDMVLHKNHQLGGFSADMQLIPDKNEGVLVICNIAGDFNPQLISEKLINWLNGKALVYPKTPINILMGKTLAHTKSLDSTFKQYTILQQNQPNKYNYSEEALSQLGVNLFYRLNRRTDALRVYEFCALKNPNSAYAHLNLVEAHILQKDTVRAKESLTKVKSLPINKPEILPRLYYVEELLKNHRRGEN